MNLAGLRSVSRTIKEPIECLEPEVLRIFRILCRQLDLGSLSNHHWSRLRLARRPLLLLRKFREEGPQRHEDAA